MKKLATFICAVAIGISTSACNVMGNSTALSSLPSSTVNSESSSIDPKISSAQSLQTKFEQFEFKLNKLNIKYKKVTMGAELVGAEQGTKYKLSDGSVEIYKFAKNSDAYKKAVKVKALFLDGFGNIPAEFNGNMALIFDDEIKEKSVVENIFKSLK